MADQFVGEIRLFGFSRIPSGWAACDGASLEIARNEPLYALIGTAFGGNGVDHFNVPDLRGRVPLSQGTGRGLTSRELGQSGGAENHSLTTTEMPAHGHPLVATTTIGSVQTPGPAVQLASASMDQAKLYAPAAGVTKYDTLASCIGPAGRGLPHDNMMPTLTANYCICLEGIFPHQS